MDQISKYTIGDVDVVALYFSSSYCKWCSDFTPQLRSVYPYFNQYNIEIVMVGSDKTAEAYEEYASRQIWPVMDFDDSARLYLRDTYDIKTIPALVFVKANGDVLEAHGRSLVSHAIDTMYGPTDATKFIATNLGIDVYDDYDSDDSDF